MKEDLLMNGMKEINIIFKGKEKRTMNEMKVLRESNPTIEKEKQKIKVLEEAIKQDKLNNDSKSLKYHTMALNESKKMLEELQKHKQ